jgi:hypothetical protein
MSYYTIFYNNACVSTNLTAHLLAQTQMQYSVVHHGIHTNQAMQGMYINFL